jgi:histidinol-phosphatase (PHP family)
MADSRDVVRLRADLHIHSRNSCDSESTLDEVCQGAIRNGVSIVCFTEHVDMNPRDEGYGYFQIDRYARDIESAREKHEGQLEILKGVEFSEPHLYPKEFEAVNRADFDFVLGSVHWVEGFGAWWADPDRLLPEYPAERLSETYYNEVLMAARFGGFDSIAHIDFPKRYLPLKHEPVAILNDIMAELVKNGIALELNSQPVRSRYGEINPSDHICGLYTTRGGEIVTTGSDAHRPEDVGQDFDRIDAVIHGYAFTTVVFRKRKQVRLEGLLPGAHSP